MGGFKRIAVPCRTVLHHDVMTSLLPLPPPLPLLFSCGVRRLAWRTTWRLRRLRLTCVVRPLAGWLADHHGAQLCGDFARQPMMTPCGHLLCLDCTARDREACPACREPYAMQVGGSALGRGSGEEGELAKLCAGITAAEGDARGRGGVCVCVGGGREGRGFKQRALSGGRALG